ncbi:MAG: mediator of RNA polymerase II transcription subunit 8 [Pycnora praestabilis]|nr:MAG: mediator of RNA polymerase II transcription subunit 8 [Pycnora praestabilis]
MNALSPEDIKALEQTRQRLFQLTNSLNSLQGQIQQSEILPPWTSLQSLATIISQNLLSVSQHMNAHHDRFASMAVYPLSTFPGNTQEGLLTQLLRKKLEPNVEDWVERGREVTTKATDAAAQSSEGFQIQQLTELWDWAGRAANEEARKRNWVNDEYTLEERENGIENVITGLRRKLEESSDEEDDDDDNEEAVEGDAADGEMEVVGVRRKSGQAGMEFDLRRESEHKAVETSTQSLPINDIFRFMSTGTEPMIDVEGFVSNRNNPGLAVRR